MSSKVSFVAAVLVSMLPGAVACGSSAPPPAEPGITQSVATKATAEATPATTASAPTSVASSVPAAPTSVAVAGKSCTATTDCAKGEICAGEEGCDQTWTCKPSQPCTRDLQSYCGCDGKTFQGSGSCPPKKYKKKGAC